MNDLYITHKEILASFSLLLKKHTIDEAQVMEWCQEVERDHIADASTMCHYVDIAIEAKKYSDDYNTFELPCNVYRLLNVYSSKSDPLSHIKYKRLFKSKMLIAVPSSYDVVYLSFIGNPVDDNGTPLIVKDHKQACITYCTMKLLYEDYYLGGANVRYEELSARFSNQTVACRQSVRHLPAEHFNKLNVVNGDMLESIGSMRVVNKMIEE